MTEEIEYVLMDDGQIYAKRKMDTNKTVHGEEKPYKCSICSAAFTCEKNLRIHAQLSHHSMDNLQLETFPSNPELKSDEFNRVQENSPMSVHDGKDIMKNNSNVEEKCSTLIKENTSRLLFQCELCNLNFEHEQDLHVHKWVHLTNKPSEVKVKKQFPCLICTHTYDQNCKLKQHVESLHEGIRFPCTLCSKTFIDKYKLKRHIRTAHEGKNSELNVNNLETQFSTQENFQSQVKKATGLELLSNSVTVNEVNSKELIKYNIQELSQFNNQEFTTFDNQELVTFKNQELNSSNSEEIITFNIQQLSPYNNQKVATFDNLELTGLWNQDSETFKNQELTTFNSEELTTLNNVELEPPEMVISTFSPYEILQPSFDTTDFNNLNETTETKLEESQEIFQKNIMNEEKKIESNTQSC